VAATNTQSDVFKFVALRPPKPPSRDAANLNFISDDRNTATTPVARFLAQFNPENADRAPAALKAFIAEHHYDPAFPQSQGDTTLDKVLAAAAGVPSGSISTAALVSAIQAATDQSVDTLYSSTQAVAQRGEIWDRYYAFYLLTGVDLGPLTTNLRAFHLLNLLDRGHAIADVATLNGILNATVLVDPLFVMPKPKAAPPPDPTPLPADKAARFKDLWAKLVDTDRALTEVRNLSFTTALKSATKEIPAPTAPPADRTARAAAAGTEAAITRLPPAPISQTTIDLKLAVDPGDFAALHNNTKTVLQSLRFSQGNLEKSAAITKLNTQMQTVMSSIDAIDDPRFLDLMPAEAADIRGLKYTTDRLSRLGLLNPDFGLFFGDNVRGEIKPLGIGDLKVVKQTLVSYQLGEVAHIENVLRGEYKERKYRVLDRTEQTLDVTQETTEETTKDTQTTERFELKKESENTISEQMSVQAGVTVTGSYGMVTIGAHGDFAYGTSSQQSSKTSSNFAREVVDRSVSRIQKSVKEERITKTLHEVEEIDTHGLDNKGQPDNLTGVYRWVDKYYKAQIYNYGKRLMFEFIVPEPAAFYGYAQTHQPVKAIPKPVPLPSGLTHKDITENNYQSFIRDYQVQGCVPPPPETKVVSVILSSDAKIENGTALAKSSKELVVPEGYVCDYLSAALSFNYENYPEFKLSVGPDALWAEWHTNAGLKKIDWTGGGTYAFDGIIPVALNIYDVNSYFVSVMANCSRTWQSYETWQIQTFEKIVAAYQALTASYNQQVAQQQVQQGVAIHGQNPLINRQIEKTELKKSSVKLLMDTWQFGSFSAMKESGGAAPDFNIHQAVSEGKIEQFFEQAFEWENLTYLFYPYFWGRRERWVSLINTYDEDPLFTQFLQAGAARVLVPVHPGYNDAVMYFLENNGAIWNGGEPPRLNDPMFISLADELREITDDLQNATADGDPWQVILPTTLVYLQKDASLPTFP